MLLKTSLREIRTSLGRYLAIFSIIALGVGFFAGLRVTRAAMLNTADEYLSELHMFDGRLLSTLGWTQEDVDAFAGLAGVRAAAGVTQRVDLPVGLNLIDQTTTTTDWSFNANRGGGQPIIFPRFQVSRAGSAFTTTRDLDLHIVPVLRQLDEEDLSRVVSHRRATLTAGSGQRRRRHADARHAQQQHGLVRPSGCLVRLALERCRAAEGAGDSTGLDLEQECRVLREL